MSWLGDKLGGAWNWAKKKAGDIWGGVKQIAAPVIRQIAAPVVRALAPAANVVRQAPRFFQNVQRSLGSGMSYLGQDLVERGKRALPVAARLNPGTAPLMTGRDFLKKEPGTPGGLLRGAAEEINPFRSPDPNKVHVGDVIRELPNTAKEFFVEPVAREGARIQVDLNKKKFQGEFKPQTGLQKFFYGEEPITGHTQYGRQVAELAGKDKGQSLSPGAATGLGVAAGVLDILPFGGKAKSSLKSFAKAGDEAAVRTVLKEHGNLDLTPAQVKKVTPGLTAAKTPEEAAQALSGVGIRDVQTKGGVVRPRQVTVQRSAGKPLTLTPDTGINPLRDQGGDPNVIRQVSRELDRGRHVTIAPTVSVTAESPSALGRRLGDARTTLGPDRQKQKGFAVLESKAPEPIAPKPETAPNKTFDEMSQKAEAERTRYEEPSKVRQAEAGIIQYSPATRMDVAYAKKTGQTLDTLPASQSLEHLTQVADNSSVPAVQRLRDFGVWDLVKKYAPGTQAEKDFNNYRNAKMAIEAFDKKGIQMWPDANIEELRKAVSQYEGVNKEAVADLRSMKPWSDSHIDDLVAAGRLTDEEGKALKGAYEFFSPQGRVTPEALARATVNSKSRTGGSRSVIQPLKGGETALDDTWTPVLDRAFAVERQIEGSAVPNELYSRIEEGNAPGRIVQSVDQAKQQAAAKELLDTSRATAKALYKEIGSVSTKRRLSALGRKEAESAAVRNARAKLRAAIPADDRGALAAVDSLTRRQLLDLFQQIAEEPGSKLVGRRLGEEYKYAQSLEDRLGELRSNQQSTKDFGKVLQDEISALKTEPTRGHQVITFKREGHEVKIEVDPETYTFLQGLGSDHREAVTTFLQELQRPFRTTFTGWLNPLFALKSFIHYDAPMVLVNSKNGVRALLSPNSNKALIQSIRSSDDFQQELRRFGANQIGGSLLPIDSRVSAEMIAAEGNLAKQAKLALTSKEARRQLAQKYDVLGGKLAAGRRSQIAAAHYESKFGSPFSPKNADINPDLHWEAMHDATWAYNNVMPNYQATGKIIRMIDSILPYSAAGAAGTRSFLTAIRRRPWRTTAILSGVFVLPAVASTAHNLASQEGQDFYKDMAESGNTITLNNNYIIVLPGAHKDPKTGEWHGIIKIPIAPEFRGMNEGIWRNVYGLTQGEGIDPKAVGMAAVNTVTGGFFQNQGLNPALRVGGGIAFNRDPQTGREVVPADMASLPRDQQSSKNTSVAAKFLSDLAEKSGIPFLKDFSPMQVDFALSQLGLVGKGVQGKGNPIDELQNQYTKAVGISDGRKFYQAMNDAAKGIVVRPANDSQEAIAEANKQTENLRATFKEYMTRSAFGDLSWNKQAQASLLLRAHEAGPQVWEAIRKVNGVGDNPDPLWKLPDDQARAVLILRSFHPHGFGLGAPAEEAQKDFLRDQPWYKQYLLDEKSHYDKLPEDIKKKIREGEDPSPNTPIASNELQAKLDQLSNITDSKLKSKFIRDNPDVSAFFSATNTAKEAQREDMGLFRDLTKGQEASLNEYNRLKDSGLSTKGFIRAHPELGTLFDVMGGIKNQAETLQASYEGRQPKLSSGTGGGGRRRGGGRKRRGGVRTKRIKVGKIRTKKATITGSVKTPISKVNVKPRYPVTKTSRSRGLLKVG